MTPSSAVPPWSVVETAVGTPLVVVTVGTDHHRFDRLVRWIDAWYARHDGAVRVLAQTGTAARSRAYPCSPYLAPTELEEAVAAATAVVSHGGPATIMGIRSRGLLPIVVPRDARLGEHVDDHQQRFARWLASRGEIALALTEVELHRRLDVALAEPEAFRLAGSDGDPTARTVDRFGQLVDDLLAQRR
jgi:UDP-N-acetylglucosamine transferase subunit ALG13